MTSTTNRRMPTERHLSTPWNSFPSFASCSKQGTSHIGADFLFWHRTCNLFHCYSPLAGRDSCVLLGELSRSNSYPVCLLRTGRSLNCYPSRSSKCSGQQSRHAALKGQRHWPELGAAGPVPSSPLPRSSREIPAPRSSPQSFPLTTAISHPRMRKLARS